MGGIEISFDDIIFDNSKIMSLPKSEVQVGSEELGGKTQFDFESCIKNYSCGGYVNKRNNFQITKGNQRVNIVYRWNNGQRAWSAIPEVDAAFLIAGESEGRYILYVIKKDNMSGLLNKQISSGDLGEIEEMNFTSEDSLIGAIFKIIDNLFEEKTKNV